MTGRAEPGDPLDLDQIERTLAELIPGERRHLMNELCHPEAGYSVVIWPSKPEQVIAEKVCTALDAKLLAVAPTWLAALVAALRDARQRVTELEEHARKIHACGEYDECRDFYGWPRRGD